MEKNNNNNNGFTGAKSIEEAHYSIFDFFKFPVCIISKKNNEITYSNSEFKKLFELDNNSISLDLSHPFSPEYRKKIAGAYTSALKGHQKHCFAIMKTSDNIQIPVEIFLFPMFSDNHVSSILSFFNVVEDRVFSFDKSASTVLKEDIVINSNIYEFLPFPIMILNDKGEILDGSASLESLSGYSIKEMLKKSDILLELVSPYDFERIKKSVRDLLEGNISFKRIGEVKIATNRKDEKWVNMIMYPITGGSNVLAVETILEDITKIKNLETQLGFMSRIQIFGDLVNGLLHSFSNLINIITSKTQLIMQISEKDIVLDGLKIIEKTAEDGARHIRRIQNFISKSKKFEEDEENLIDIIEDAIVLSRIQFSAKEKEEKRFISINQKYFSNLKIKSDNQLLREILLSMIFKVSSFIQKDGNINIELLENHQPCISVETRKDIEPADSSDVKSERFLLSGVDIRRIAEKINVKIIEEESSDIYSIKAILPSRIVTKGERIKTETVDFKLRDYKIIIVEDEKALGKILFETFDRLGNQIFLCENGEEALEEFKNNKYDILITDYGLTPSMTGLELSARVKEINEGVTTVLLSGWIINDISAYKNIIDLFIQKPFELKHLINDVSRIQKSKKK